MNIEPKWLEEPKPHNYPAASSYLNLTFTDSECDRLVKALKSAPIVTFKAKDILRASGLTILPKDNRHIRSNLQKISQEEELSPILLVRNSILRKLIIADGYHRLCTIYYVDEDLNVPVKIASV